MGSMDQVTEVFEDTIVFQREIFTRELLNEAMPLCRAHYDELAEYKDFPLNPSFETYLQMDALHALRVFTVRKNNRLVGYAIFSVYPHPHFTSMIHAVNDTLFLLKELRHGWLGYKFIRWIDEQLIKEGVNTIYQYSKMDHDFGGILLRLGYREHDIVYSRRVS